MPNPVNEVVTRPFTSPAATGAYTGDESIVQTGTQLNLALFKDANLAVQACSNAPQFTIDANESLTTSANKVKTAFATTVTIHFDLAVNASVVVTGKDGAPNPFNTTLAIDGDITVTMDKYGHSSCKVHYTGDYCGAKMSCTGTGQMTSSGLVLNNATTTYTFDDPGGNGFAALILDDGQLVNSASGATVTDPHMAMQGAAGVVLGAGALLFAFGTHAEDPVQGINFDDAAVIGGMGAAAMAIIAHPDSQSTAINAALALTKLGAKLAMDDTLAAYDVVADPHATQTGFLHTGSDYWFA